MNAQELNRLLQSLVDGQISVADGVERLKHLPFEDLGIAQIDHHRELRQGVPEVVLGESKTVEQLHIILSAMAKHGRNILVTRLDGEKGTALCNQFPEGEYDSDARAFCLVQQKIEITGRGRILVICAGTSDLPVAREAVITAKMLGNEVDELVDVGVAGIHRLLARQDLLREAAVLIVIAGMEGALPSVVGGLVAVPVQPVSCGVLVFGCASSGLGHDLLLLG